jgi:hypothetical protein
MPAMPRFTTATPKKRNSAPRYAPKPYRDLSGIGTRQRLAAWHCVHIPHTCVFHAVNQTFLNMMFENGVKRRADCAIYRTVPDDADGYVYYFSPGAVEQYKGFLRFWGSTDIAEPDHLGWMRRIV